MEIGTEAAQFPEKEFLNGISLAVYSSTSSNFWWRSSTVFPPNKFSNDACLYLCSSRYPAPEKPRQKRAVIQDMVRPLKHWLLRHRHNPYPTKARPSGFAYKAHKSHRWNLYKHLYISGWSWSNVYYTVKKRLVIFPSPAGMSPTKLSLHREQLNYFPPGTGKSLTFFTVKFR